MFMLSGVKKWCDGCNKRTKHDSEPIGTEREKNTTLKEAFSLKGIIAGIVTLTLYWWWKLPQTLYTPQVFFYDDRCRECGHKSKSRSSSMR